MSKKENSGITIQIAIILSIISVFFLAAMTSDAVPVRQHKAVIFCIWGVTLLLWRKADRTVDRRQAGWMKWFSANREFVAVLTVCVISRLFMGAKLQRWDGALYYGALLDACRAFDFTFDSFWNSFRFFSHPTLGYAFIMSIGEFLTPGRLTGLYLVNLILTAGALYCVYILFQEYWARVSAKRAAIYTFLVSSVPLFWGTFSYVNPDYCIILFFIFMVYEESREHYILMTFWLIVLALTKETAMLVVAGYFLFKGLYYFFEGNYSLPARLKNVFQHKCMQIALLGALGVLCFFLKQKHIFSWSNVDLFNSFMGVENDFDELPYNAFVINADFIALQTKLVFVLNFAWIFTGIVLFSWIMGICKKRQYPVSEKWLEHVVGMIGSFILMNVFLMAFITVPLNRYHVFTAVALVIMSVIFYENILKSRVIFNGRIEKGCIILVGLLFSIQTFFSVDPVSNAIFMAGDTGKMKILATGGAFEPYFDDVSVNNFQYTWMDEELEHMLREAGYDAETLVIGNKYNVKIYCPGWNTVTEEMAICSEFAPDVYPISMISTRQLKKSIEEGSFYNRSFSKKQRAIIFFTPYDEEPEADWIALLSQYYDVSERKETNGRRGSLIYYELILKEVQPL